MKTYLRNTQIENLKSSVCNFFKQTDAGLLTIQPKDF